MRENGLVFASIRTETRHKTGKDVEARVRIDLKPGAVWLLS